jgi:hypothetical protein
LFTLSALASDTAPAAPISLCHKLKVKQYSGIEGVESGQQEDSSLCTIKNMHARKTVRQSNDEISRTQVHSLDRVNRLVHLERFGQRLCTCMSNLVSVQPEGASSDSGTKGVEFGQVDGSTLSTIGPSIARKTVRRSNDEISWDCALT